MSNTNCDLLHKEYKELKQKIRALDNSEKFKPYSFINAKDILRIGEIARELVTKHADYVKTLSASDRFDLENDPSLDDAEKC